MPRSTRTSLLKPHWCAMSVAFDDHGEIVPRRGTVTSVAPSVVSAISSAPSNSHKCALSDAVSESLHSMKKQYVAVMRRTSGTRSTTAGRRRARRAEENAAPPRSLRISVIERAGENNAAGPNGPPPKAHIIQGLSPFALILADLFSQVRARQTQKASILTGFSAL